jgi:hypothetical protein
MRSLILWSILAAVTVAGAPPACGKNAKQKREAAYQSTLQSYTAVLKPGITRKNVEDYLRAKHASFFQEGGGTFTDDNAFADLTKIGNEKHPWYCSEHAVYIAFRFAAVFDPTGLLPRSDRDILKSITVYHQLEVCL